MVVSNVSVPVLDYSESELRVVWVAVGRSGPER